MNIHRLTPHIIALALAAFTTTRAADAPGPLVPVLQSLLDKRLAAGVVALVADNDKVLDLEAVGYASLETKTPMRTDNLFWIASMTKSITAAACVRAGVCSPSGRSRK